MKSALTHSVSKHHQGTTLHQFTRTCFDDMDDPPVGFRFQFLGKADLLNAMSTGFASLQRHLKTIYFQHLRRLAQKAKPEEVQTLLLERDGLTVEANDRICEHYPYSHVAYTDMTRFEVFREGKRFLGSFRRYSEDSEGGPVEVVSLDNKSVINFPHPPLVVAVLRRSRGVRLLECHVFAAESELCALAFVQEVQHKLEGHRHRETLHLFQPQRASSSAEDPEAFRQTMRSLSRPRTMSRSQTTQAIYSGGSEDAVVAKPPERDPSPPSPVPPPRTKPRRSQTLGRPAQSANIPRAKSLNFLDPAVAPSQLVGNESESESENETSDWRPDGSSQRVPHLVTRFEARQRGADRPIARVRPRLAPHGAGSAAAVQTLNPKQLGGATERHKVHKRHEEEQQRMKTAEIAAAVHRLDLRRSQKDFPDALGYLP